MRQANDEEEII